MEAIHDGEDGVYWIDDALCTGCMLCVEACPYGVLVENRHAELPIKCTLCGACVEVCPRDAIVLA